jgi:hypothetical protein
VAGALGCAGAPQRLFVRHDGIIEFDGPPGAASAEFARLDFWEGPPPGCHSADSEVPRFGRHGGAGEHGSFLRSLPRRFL